MADSRDVQLVAKARVGPVRVVKGLLDAGADPNCKVHGSNPLCEASSAGSSTVDVVSCLIQHGAEVNGSDAHGKRPLHHASMCGNLATVDVLLAEGASINARDKHGNTALYEAARGGHAAVFKRLLEKNADLAVQNNSGETALHAAARTGYCPILKHAFEFCASRNANANIQEIMDVKNIKGQTAFLQAFRRGRFGSECASFLLEKGADCSVPDRDGGSRTVDISEIETVSSDCVTPQTPRTPRTPRTPLGLKSGSIDLSLSQSSGFESPSLRRKNSRPRQKSKLELLTPRSAAMLSQKSFFAR